MFNCSQSLIRKIWKENGLNRTHKRTYTANFEYFKDIDSRDKAYFLGFIAADGCVFKRDGHVASLSIIIHNDDIEILNLLNQCMDSNYKIHQLKNKPHSTLAMNSDVLVACLNNYGIHYRKTWTYTPVVLSEDLMWHFIRGFYDGDGGISYNTKFKFRPSGWYIHFCGNEQNMLFIYEFLLTHGITSTIVQDSRTEKYKHKFFSLRISSNKSKKIFLNKLYDGAENFKLNRKYNSGMELLELIKTFKKGDKYEKNNSNDPQLHIPR